MVRVHIDKKAFISCGFWYSDNFVSKELGQSLIWWPDSGHWLVDDLVRVHMDNFFELKMTGWIFLYELEPNHQPISDRINHGASSYKEKLALHRNQRDINPFLSIRTRTIFEFIYALSFIMLLIWVISYGVYYMIYTLWISSQSLCVVCNVFIIIISGMCLAVSFNHWRCIIFVSMILEHQMQSNTYLGLRVFLIKYVLFNLVCVKGWFKFTISYGPYEIHRPISWSISYGPYDSKSFRRFLNDSILKQVNKLTRIKL